MRTCKGDKIMEIKIEDIGQKLKINNHSKIKFSRKNSKNKNLQGRKIKNRQKM